MHLIAALAAGVEGAGNGTADIYRHGTSTRAATYSDFDGLSANGTSAGLTLDANGGVTVYVGQVVDVVVKDSSGSTVRSFTAGADATAIQYSGTAFLGTNPVTGASAINQPANLKSILDLLRTSFGATQGKVSFGGSDRLLYEVLAGLNYFYNVKDPLYGALGNGSTDDTSAIQAACTAAGNAGGGIVFFPKGTYKTSGKLTAGLGVSFLGAGPQSTIIASTGNDGVTNITVLFQSDAVGYYAPRFCAGIQFNASGTHAAGSIISLGNAVNVAFRDCQFGGDSGFDQCTLVSGNGSTTGFATFENCSFTVVATGQKAIGDLDSAAVTVRGCRAIVKPATYTGDVFSTGAGETKIRDCSFNASAVTSGTVTCIDTGAYGAGTATVSGCYFLGGGGGNVYAMDFTAGELFEEGNVVEGATTYLYNTGISTAANMDECHIKSREHRQVSVTCANTTAVAVNALEYGVVYANTTGAVGVRSITLAACPAGSTMRVFVTNNGSGSHTFTVNNDAGSTYTAATGSVAAGSLGGCTCASIWFGSDAEWLALGNLVFWP